MCLWRLILLFIISIILSSSLVYPQFISSPSVVSMMQNNTINRNFKLKNQPITTFAESKQYTPSSERNNGTASNFQTRAEWKVKVGQNYFGFHQDNRDMKLAIQNDSRHQNHLIKSLATADNLTTARESNETFTRQALAPFQASASTQRNALQSQGSRPTNMFAISFNSKERIQQYPQYPNPRSIKPGPLPNLQRQNITALHDSLSSFQSQRVTRGQKSHQCAITRNRLNQASHSITRNKRTLNATSIDTPVSYRNRFISIQNTQDQQSQRNNILPSVGKQGNNTFSEKQKQSVTPGFTTLNMNQLDTRKIAMTTLSPQRYERSVLSRQSEEDCDNIDQVLSRLSVATPESVSRQKACFDQKTQIFKHLEKKEFAQNKRDKAAQSFKQAQMIVGKRRKFDKADSVVEFISEEQRRDKKEMSKVARKMESELDEDLQACQIELDYQNRQRLAKKSNIVEQLNCSTESIEQIQRREKETKFLQTRDSLLIQGIEDIKELDYDESADMWSQSDASDYRQDEKHMQMDNKLLDRLYKAAENKNHIVAPQHFRQRNLDCRNDKEREQQIALKFADWYILKNQNNEVDNETQTEVRDSTPVRDFTRRLQETPEVERDEAVVKRAEKIVKQIKLFEIGQQSHAEYFCHAMGNDPNLMYHRVVDKAHEIILPLLDKIVDNQLILKDYTLDSGHLNGLAAVLKNKTVTIDAVLFDNCGIDDEELAILLEGFMALPGIKSFTYKNNVFQHLGLEAIKPVLGRPDPRNLQELRLVNCVTHSQIMTEMIQYMIDEQVQVRSLSLVKMQISKICLDKIADFVKESQYLEDLDLSWNNFLPLDFGHLFNVLSTDQTLRSVNLSCNTIIDKEHQNQDEIDEEFTLMLDDFDFRRREATLAGERHILDQAYITKYSVLAVYGLGKLIRHNRILQSVNLNNCGLNAKVIMGLMPALRHSRSLLCLHMASNPGICDSVINLYRDKLSVVPIVPLKIRVQNEQLKQMTSEEEAQLSPRSFAERQNKVKNYRGFKNQELEKYRNTRRIKPLVYKQDATLKTDVKDLSITRILGYKEQIPDSGRWKIHTVQGQDTCWVCDNWIFTLYFWNENIGQTNDTNFIGVDEQTKVHLIQTIKGHNKETYMNAEEVPVLFTGVEQWKPKPFMKLIDYLQIIAPSSPPPFENLAKDAAKQHFKFPDMNNYPEYRQREVNAFMKKTLGKMQNEWQSIREGNTEKFVTDAIRYKNPALINANQISGNIGEIYVLPIFLPPGKHDFLVRTEKSKHSKYCAEKGFKWYYRRFISDIRQETIPLFFKQRAIADTGAYFQLQKSVFKDWKPDTAETIEGCQRNDSKFWKVNKICGGRDQAQAVLDIFDVRYVPLKEVFTASTIMNNTPPDFQRRAFFKFCQQAGMVDKKMHSGIFDTYFKATNFEEVDQDNNDDNALNRFEFFEILLRIAKGKYMDFGKETQLAYALMKLLQTYILPMVPKLWPLQSWRDKQLWCTEVNELFYSNQHQIKMVYDHIAKQRFKKERNRVDDLSKNMVSIDKLCQTLEPVLLPLHITDQMIVQGFFLSKMTVVNENDQANFEYTYIHWSEFLEFVGRISWLKYLDTYLNDQWGLTQKIKVILAPLFAMVGQTVVEPPELEMVHSDSDDDY